MKFLKLALKGRNRYLTYSILLTVPTLIFYPRNIPITLIYLLSLIWLLVVEKRFFQYDLKFIGYVAGTIGTLFALEVVLLDVYFGISSEANITFASFCFYFLGFSFGNVVFYFLLNPNNPKKLQEIALNDENFNLVFLLVCVILELISNPTTWPALTCYVFATILLVLAQTFFDKNYPNFWGYGFSIIGGYMIFGAFIWAIALEQIQHYAFLSPSSAVLLFYLDRRIKRRNPSIKLRKPSL